MKSTWFEKAFTGSSSVNDVTAVNMTDLELKLPPRNILTGAVVKWNEDEENSDVEYSPKTLTLAWKDLSVYRKKKIQTSLWKSATYEEVRVLHGVNGAVTSGNLVALMGSSGAGKTTLLAAISRRDKSAMTGYLMLNGRLAGAELVARISGFVPQEDLAIDDLTVTEHMEFMARMMMDRRSSAEIRTRRIQLLLSELGVDKCTRTKLKALSGGERKRVALAVQLLNDPPILFCDEPTTGLDSWAANSVISRLRRLANTGKLVVCSVHQPASGVFEMFHQVVLLTNGRIAFHGSTEQAYYFFGSLGYKCPPGFNAAEYYVSLLGIQLDKEEESRERIRRICDEYQRSVLADEIAEKLEEIKDEDEYFNGTLTESQNAHFSQYLTLRKVNYFVQFYWLMWRNIQQFKQNRSIWFSEFGLLMFVGFVISVPYHGRFDVLDQRDIQNAQGLFFLTIIETIFLFAYSIVPPEVPLLLRETANELYNPLPYYLAKMVFWIPRAVISPTLYASLIYVMAGLSAGFSDWLGFCLICILCANYATAYGSVLTTAFEKREKAVLFSVPFDFIGTMFSGLYLNLATVSPFFSWLRYFSGFYYGVESISILKWDSIKMIECVEETGIPCIRTGSEVLEKYGFEEWHFWRNCVLLVVMYFIAHFISYVMVVKRARGTPVY